MIVKVALVVTIALIAPIVLVARIARIVPDCLAVLVGSITRLRMTVKELRELLQNVPDDTKVLVYDVAHDNHVDADFEYSTFYKAVVFSQD